MYQVYRVPQTSLSFYYQKTNENEISKFYKLYLPCVACSMKNVRTSVTLDLYVSTLLQLYTDSIHSSTIGFNAFLEILF